MEINVIRYRARAGAGFSHAKANQFGRELESIAIKHGDLKPGLVVEEARPEESPIHEAFEWDDSEAARLHRENQARRLMNRIDVVLNVNGNKVETRGFINVFVNRDGEESSPEEAAEMVEARRAGAADKRFANAYKPAPKVIAAPELQAQYEAQALGELERWARRFRGVEALTALVRRVEEAVEEIRADAAA